MPDFLIPVAGYLDDLTFIWLAVRWLLKSGTSQVGGRWRDDGFAASVVARSVDPI
jgi:uncharacterized membrane protein YkvA (DUF1232 family)